MSAPYEPRPREGAAVYYGDSAAIFLIGGDCLDIRSDGRLNIAETWNLLREGQTALKISEETDCPLEVIEAFIEELRIQGALTFREPAEYIDREEAARIIIEACLMWKRHTLFHPIYKLLGDSEERLALLSALLVETAHYVRRAPLVDEFASDYVSSVKVAAALRHQSHDEKLHHIELDRAVGKLLGGVPPSEISRSVPSVAMRGLLGIIENLARTNPVSFLTSLLLSEADPLDTEKAFNDFVALGPRNGVDGELLIPFANHMRMDVEAGHAGLAADLLAAELPRVVHSGHLNTVLDDAHSIKHGFDLINDTLIASWAKSGSVYRLNSGFVWSNF